MENKTICSECGKEIKNTYFTILDNFLIIKYFDSDKDNIFCSQECLNKALTIEEVELEEEKEITLWD